VRSAQACGVNIAVRVLKGLSLPWLLAVTAGNCRPVVFSGAQPLDIPYYFSSSAAGDLNGDGKPDLVVTTGGFPSSAVVYLNRTLPGARQPEFAIAQVFAIPSVAYGFVGIVDINGDGKPDVIADSSDSLCVLINTTEQTADNVSFAPCQSIPLDTASYFAVADFNNDGKPDLAVISPFDKLHVLINTTSARASTVTFAAPTTVVSGADADGLVRIAVADVNGDGRLDLVFHQLQKVDVLLNETSPSDLVPRFGSTQAFPIAGFVEAIAVMDADSDGKPDVLVSTSEAKMILLANQTPAKAAQVSFAARQTLPTGLGAGSIAIGDIDGDGVSDILTLNVYDGTVSLLKRSGTGASTTFAAQNVLAASLGAADFHVIDVNGDGAADVVVADPNGPRFLMLMNDAGVSVNLDQHALTGSWYNPATSGQGFEIEIYPDVGDPTQGILFAGWFTYDASGLHSQRWLALTGPASAQIPTSNLQIYDVEGGNFAMPPALPPGYPLGIATLQFSDCNSGSVVYQFSDGRSGIVPLVRLTPNVNCTPAGDDVHANTGSYGLSGNWFDPATSGQGLLFDFAPSINTVFAAWYTFSQNGQGIAGAASQRWYTLQSDRFVPGVSSLNDIPIIDTRGGEFDKSTPVTSTQVGSADIAFQNCNAMTLSYRFTSGENVGLANSIHLQRAGPVPSICNL
jgi:hypothetical protein